MTSSPPAPTATRSPHAPRTHAPQRGESAVIALGGAIGASLRHAVYMVGPMAHPGLLWDTVLETLAINLLGALLLGALYGRLSVRGGHPLLRPFLGIGVLGSFTTYSAFVLELSELGREAGLAPSLTLVIAPVVLGVGLYRLGERLATGPPSPGQR